jgi:hypothetical protein
MAGFGLPQRSLIYVYSVSGKGYPGIGHPDHLQRLTTAFQVLPLKKLGRWQVWHTAWLFVL